MKNKIAILRTDDYLYYVIWNVPPFTIEKKAIKYAQRIQRSLDTKKNTHRLGRHRKKQ